MTTASGLAYVAVTVTLLLTLPSHRPSDLLLAAVLLAGYVVASRVRFEYGTMYVSAEQLVFVPSLFMLPLSWAPALVAAAGVISLVPDVAAGNWHRDRLLGSFSDTWGAFGPVLVLALLAPGPIDLAHAPVYLIALSAQFAFDLMWVIIRDRLLDRVPILELLKVWTGTIQVDAMLSPVALMLAAAAVNHTWAVFAAFPLMWMLLLFSRDRQARYESALELQRAYRGTVTLLSDVVEFDDPYTAAHSRSIVELVDATAERLGVPQQDRQRLEFAALLHDVGKIAIPKALLNKPAALTDAEFAVMKTHTIEGQYMLDRIGGFLGEIGEIVRSCHERWDGGGYPDGLKGEQIPFAARLVFACDAYNAMTTDRVYRAALPRAEAIAELERHAGTQFDPLVVTALVEVVEEGEPAVVDGDTIRAILAGQPAPRDAVQPAS